MNMKKTIFFFVCVAMATSAMAQKSEGSISADMLSKIESMQTTGTTDKALFNAIAANSIDNLAKNFANNGPENTYFSNETTSQSIHDQKSSGRCWMFSGLNVLRANFAKQHKDTMTVEFSQAYLFFYDQLEKANLMLQGAIDMADKPMDDKFVRMLFKTPISDGGTFCGVADLAEKYGLVPMSVQPETYSADNTSRMSRLIDSKLREYGLELRQMVADKKKAKAIKDRKTEMLATIYHMLAISLGEPVKEFSYAFVDKKGKTVTEKKTYTPMQFYRETVGGPINGTFIMAMNDPRREYYKTYEVEWDRHTYDGHNWKYVNLPMDDIEQLAIASIKDNTKLYSSYDVGKQFDRKNGFLDVDVYDYGTLFGTTFPMDKAQRIMTFDSGSTHAMTLTAVDLDENGKAVKWKVENSWGTSSGKAGYLIMTDSWFREYMFRLVVDKKYVPERILEAEKQKPVMVMPDDPLFLEDE
ncbi:MAG: C1 family peptidase [Prevotella sp.]|nr:C1 family peptidase [Prevotella sp.]